MDSVAIMKWFNIGALFYGAAAVVLLFSKKGAAGYANKVLAWALIFCMWYLFTTLLFITDVFAEFPHLFRVGLPLYYTIPPLIYLYVRSRMNPDFTIRKADMLHFIPVLLALADQLPFYVLPAAEKAKVLTQISNDFRTLFTHHTGFMPDFIHPIMRSVQGIGYMGVIILYLLQYPADPERDKEYNVLITRWLMAVAVFFGIIYFGHLVNTIFFVNGGMTTDELLDISLVPFISGTLAFIGLNAFIFYYPEVLTGEIKRDIPRLSDIRIFHRQKEAKTDEHISFEWIRSQILEKKLFKNPKITAPEVARELHIAPHLLSTVLNQQGGLRFQELINQFRIEYVVEEFRSGKNRDMSIEGIATEAGFASRSTFYDAFKKSMGKTPTEFIRSLPGSAAEAV